MLRAGNSGDGMVDLSGAAAAPVRQRLEECGWRGGPGVVGWSGVKGRLEEGSQIQADQAGATQDGTIRVKLVKLAPNMNPPANI